METTPNFSPNSLSSSASSSSPVQVARSQEQAQTSAQSNSLEEHWMPFTPNREFKDEPRLVSKSEGVHMWDHRGRKVLDGASGLFCVPAGHGRKKIAEAVYQQLLTNDYTAPFNLGHSGSFEFARKIAALAPDPINHVFFCNSGSEAIDTAIKIAMAYHGARGDHRRLRFVSRERAYHGVNIGGVSLSGMIKNRDTFPVVMPYVVTMRHTWSADNLFVRGQGENGADLANDLQRIVDTYGGHTIAAVFVEPVAGSTGCLVPPKGYLARLREICDQNGILLVFDEVITGFGRLGHAFASQAFGVIPDMMTMAKAMTNGCQPMGGVAVRDHIYDTIIDAGAEGAIELFHGYTYSGHPASCAAGIATLEIYEQEKLFDRVADLSEYFLDAVYSLQDLDDVTDIRGIGFLAGIDLKPGSRPGCRGPDLQKKLFANGLHMKFTGDCGLMAPLFIAQKSQIDEMVEIFRQTLTNT